jgi:predicted GNAT family N-acyltransferase
LLLNLNNIMLENSLEIRSPKTEKEWESYYDLRYRILRKPLNQPIGSEKNDGDETGIHFALFENKTNINSILAIARLDLQEDNIAQVRFVAVEEIQQGLGYGLKIMQEVEKECSRRGVEKIILHARDYAVDFYLKQNYTIVKPSYKLFGVLQHFLMEKQLKKKLNLKF